MDETRGLPRPNKIQNFLLVLLMELYSLLQTQDRVLHSLSSLGVFLVFASAATRFT